MSELVVAFAATSLFEDGQKEAVDKEAQSSQQNEDEVLASKVVSGDVGRHSTSSSSTDDMVSPRPMETLYSGSDNPRIGTASAPVEEDEEEREKLASDSGYESDRRKSFSLSGAEADGETTRSSGPMVDGAAEGIEVVESLPSGNASTKAPLKPSNQERGENRKKEPYSKPEGCPHPPPPLLPLMPPHSSTGVKRAAPLPLHPWHLQQIALQHQVMLAHAQLVRPLPPHPALLLKQAQGAVETPLGPPWQQHTMDQNKTTVQHLSRMPGMPRLNPPTRPPVEHPKSSQQLPPVVLPLPVCCKASALGPKEGRKYAIPKYAVGFVIGLNGTRIQATRDVSGATILLLGDAVDHSLIGVFGTPGQIHDAVFLMKQNIVRHSGMFIGDINGMLKPIND